MATAVVALVGLLSWWLAPAATAAGLPLLDVDPLDELEILAVRTDDPAQVLFAAPARLMTQTLTSDDVIVTVDGTQQPVRLQRLSATDLELAVVLDTTVSEDDLRALQAAVVELALDLPPGATMRVIDATGGASEPAPVPGPAIAQIQQLQAGSDDNIQRAVDRATTLLGQSTKDRTALLVVGRGLSDRLDPIGDLPLESSVAYVVTVGTGGDDLLGPTTSGTVLPVDQVAGVLAAVDEMSVDLRNLYRAEVALPGPDAATLTLAIPAAGQDAAARTVALDADSVRPVEADPVQPPAADEQPADSGEAPRDDAAPDEAADTVPEQAEGRTDISLSRVLAPLLLAGAALAVVAALWLFAQRSARRRRRRRALATEGAPPAPIASGAPRSDRPRRPTRPIAKLAPETRASLARAHLGLRRLALASREAAERVPDELFRLTEARASAALSGHDVPLDAVLAADLSDGTPSDDIEMVRRAAAALSAGWQHTTLRKSTPPAVVEINAVLAGHTVNGSGDRPQRPVAPVRALNPLVEIGLEHVVLAGRSEPHSEMVARAVTAVDVMRAARLARPVLALSPRLLRDADTYRSAIAADLSDPPQRDRWLQLLCEALAVATADSAEQLTRLRRLRGRYRQQTDDTRQLPLIDLLMGTPLVNADLLEQRLSVSADTASTLLSDARDAGWLHHHPKLPDVLIADEVVALFHSSNDDREHRSQPVSTKGRIA